MFFLMSIPFQLINLLRYLADAVVRHVELLEVPQVAEEGVWQRLDQVVAGSQLGQALAVSCEVQGRVDLPHAVTWKIILR